jgi:hypothetical protein
MERNNLTLESVPMGPYNHHLNGRTTLRPSSLPHTTPYSAVHFSKPYYGSNQPPALYSPTHGKNFLQGSSYIPPPVSQDMGGIFAPSDHHLYAPKYGPPPAATAATTTTVLPREHSQYSEHLSTARPKYIHFGTHFASDKDAALLPHYRYDPTISPADISNVSPYPRSVTAAPALHVQTTYSSAPRVNYATAIPGMGPTTAVAPREPFSSHYHTPVPVSPKFSTSAAGAYYEFTTPGPLFSTSPSGGYYGPTTPAPTFSASPSGGYYGSTTSATTFSASPPGGYYGSTTPAPTFSVNPSNGYYGSTTPAPTFSVSPSGDAVLELLALQLDISVFVLPCNYVCFAFIIDNKLYLYLDQWKNGLFFFVPGYFCARNGKKINLKIHISNFPTHFHFYV